MTRLLAVILCVFSNFAYGTSAWLQDQYHGYAELKTGGYVACKAWTNSNVLKNTPCFKQFSLEPYIEYGIFPWLTFILDSYFQEFGQSGFKRPFNLQNMIVSLKSLVWNNATNIVSFQVSYNQPFQSHIFLSSMVTIYPETFFIDGQAQIFLLPTPATSETRASLERNLDIRALYGVKSPDSQAYNGWYANYAFGYQKYFQGAADQLHFDWDVGFKTLHQKLTFEFKNFNTFSLRNPINKLYPNYDLFSVAFYLLYDFYTFFGASIGVQQAVYGRNVGMGTAPSGSVYFYF